MKKVIYPVAAIVLIATSCKKDYSCTCETVTTSTTTNSLGSETTVSTSSETYQVLEAKTHQAQAACNEATVTTTNSYNVGVGTSVTNVNEKTCNLTK